MDGARKMIRFKTSTLKKVQAAAVLTRLEGGRIDRVRLLKLLYIADRESLAERGEPIVGGRVAALDNGPIHSAVYDMIKGTADDQASWSSAFQNDGHSVILIDDPGHLEMSRVELDKLATVSEAHKAIDTWALAEKTHEFPEWQEFHSRGSSKTIPLENILRAVGFSQSEIEQTQRDADSHAKMLRLLG